jgi:sialic acid synthase SpsE
MQGLIAEIGNCHLGSLDKAKRLIEVAKDSGADFVKMQAIDPLELKTGSMPFEFYDICSMSIDDYYNCYEYARCIVGIPLFFSIFGIKYHELSELDYYKISGNQYREMSPSELKKYNNENTIVSIPDMTPLHQEIDKMNIMYVTPYNCKTVDLRPIDKISSVFNKRIGYSDHSLDIDNCKRAIDSYDVNLIEKHFYLGEDIKYKGQLYRDCTHSANPEQFLELANYLKERVK